MKDPAVLALAAEQQRVLVSRDAGTMPGHFGDIVEAGNACSGVFPIPQSLDIGIAIEELLLVLLISEASEWNQRLEWLPL